MIAHRHHTVLGVLVASLALASACATTSATDSSARHAVRVDLYFGRDLHGTGTVGDEDFHAFEIASIAPRFPDGYTITQARGHWRGPGNVDTDEPSLVLTVLFPPPITRESIDARIEPIRREYCERFAQDAVMRVDTDVDVRFSGFGAAWLRAL